MTWNTALTRDFGLRLPILAGGLQWLADASYVTAAARAGILGALGWTWSALSARNVAGIRAWT